MNNNHWTPRTAGRPAEGVLSPYERPDWTLKVRAPARVGSRLQAAAEAAGYPSLAAWAVARLQAAADADLQAAAEDTASA